MIIMLSSSVPEKVKDAVLATEGIMTIKNLAEKFQLSRRTATNYLSRLENAGLITRIARGQYLSIEESRFKPELDPQVISIHQLFKKNFPFLEVVIWSIFNLKHHFRDIPVKNYVFVEASKKHEVQSIKELLFENGRESVLNPNSKDFEELNYRKEIPIVLFKRKSRYGIIKVNEVLTANSERTWLDLYYLVTRKHLNFPLGELKNILVNMIHTGEFNFSFSMRYSKIRKIEVDMLLILSKLHQEFPNYIPTKYNDKVLQLKNNLNQLFGKGWANGFF